MNAMNQDPRIDAYIAGSAPFAVPVLQHLRQVIHNAVPDIEETIKWGFPHFTRGGKIICSMAAFKQHCAFTFWKGDLLEDPHQILEKVGRTAMGHLGRIKRPEDLPDSRLLTEYIQRAVALI